MSLIEFPPTKTTGLVIVIGESERGDSYIITVGDRRGGGHTLAIEELPELIALLQEAEKECRENGMLPPLVNEPCNEVGTK